MSGADVTCHYLSLCQGRQVHYRRAGAGPPLLMLHPSPQDSQALLPAIARFAGHFTCIAPDTPGYGLSDDWLGDAPSLRDYADAIIAFADALGLDRFYLYGAATGAQIAVEIGKHHAERLALVCLDSNGHIDAGTRAAMMADYFPSVAPRRDGGHLLTYWDMCRGLFRAFPWNSEDPADRLDLPDLGPEVTQAILLRYLDAGEGYARAYRPAFGAEDVAHLAGFDAPAVMTRWEGSVVLRLADAMIAKGLPANVRVLHAGAGVDARYGVQLEALLQAQAEHCLPDFTAWPTEICESEGRAWIGGLHVRQDRSAGGPVRILLHGAGQSCASWGREWPAPDGGHSWVAPDLPGHGHSPGLEETSLDSLVSALRSAFGAEEVSGYEGVGLGGSCARQLGGIGTPLPAAKAPDLSPRTSGAHLVEAWQFAATDPRLAEHQRGFSNPSAVHERACDLLRAGRDLSRFLALEAGEG